MSQLHGSDKKVLGFLLPMFPQLPLKVIQKSVLHPSNRYGNYDEFILLERCIEDLLVQRTCNEADGMAGSHANNSNSPYSDLGIYGSGDLCGTNTDRSLVGQSTSVIPPYQDFPNVNVLETTRPGVSGVGSLDSPYVLDGPSNTSTVVEPLIISGPGSLPGTPHGSATFPSGTQVCGGQFLGGTKTGFFIPNSGQYPWGAENATGPRAEAGPHAGLHTASLIGQGIPSKEVGIEQLTKPKMACRQTIENDSEDDSITFNLDDTEGSDFDENELPDLPDVDFPLPSHPKPPEPKGGAGVKQSVDAGQLNVTGNSASNANTVKKDVNQNRIKAGRSVPGSSSFTPAQAVPSTSKMEPIPSTFSTSVRSGAEDREPGQPARNPNIGPVATQLPKTGHKRPRSPQTMITDLEFSVPAVTGALLGQSVAPDVIVEEVVMPEVITVPDIETPVKVPVKVPVKEKTAEDILQEQTNSICCLFADVDPDFVKQRLRSAAHNDPQTIVCNYLLENPGYPKKTVPKSSEASATASAPAAGTSYMASISPSPTCNKDYYKEYSSRVSREHRDQAMKLLQAEFRKVPMNNLRAISNHFNNHYAPTRKCLIEAFVDHGIDAHEAETMIGHQKIVMSNMCIPYDATPIKVKLDSHTVQLNLLKCGRHKSRLCFELTTCLLEETAFILQTFRKDTESKDHKIAEALNETEYQAEGQAIECGCCFGDFPFDGMIQCYEGHLFCQTCLNSYVKEAVFGQGKINLECLSDGCEATFPKSELLRAVPSNVVEKLEEKEREQSLNMADMTDLVRCPHCDYAAVLDPSVRVFKCENKDCRKETCRHCKEDWSDHFGIPCSELEKKDETKLRVAFEEKMSQAKIRTCPRCKAGFTKTDGCNKMTCPCGSKMCYICRTPNIDYNHFCNHPRDPGKKCQKCSNCSLWTNPEEDDERAVDEIRRAAKQEREARGFSGDKLIGAPEEPTAKKPRR